MRHLRLPTLAWAGLIWCLAGAHAEDNVKETVGGKSIDLAIPSGYCLPDFGNSGEAFFANFTTKLMNNSGNTVVKIMADCGELRRRHANASAPIYDYAVYYYPTAVENTVVTGDRQAERQSLCEQMGQVRDADLSDVPQNVAKSAEEMKTNVSVSGTKNLGVLAADAHGCYSGVLVNAKTGESTTLISAVIVATVVHSKYLFLSVYSKYENAKASAAALELAKTTAATLDAKNPD